MDGAPMARLRWRLHGAWMWPSFVVLTLLDGVIWHWLPPSGDTMSPVAAWLLGFFLSLLGIVVGAPVVALGLRRVRRDMPRVVARDYAGTALVMAVTLIMLVTGLIHHSQIGADQRALEDAVARAEAFIGDRAPATFRENLASANIYRVDTNIYRICVESRQRTRSYCVVVNRALPFGRSVKPAGSEPNSVLAQGTG